MQEHPKQRTNVGDRISDRGNHSEYKMDVSRPKRAHIYRNFEFYPQNVFLTV